MAAEQTPGTPAPTTEATTEVGGSGDPLLDAINDYKGADEGEATPAASEAEAKEAPAKEPEPEKKPEGEQTPKQKRQEFEKYLLSDGVLGTKEGIEKAAKHFRSRQSKLDGMDVRLSEKAAMLAEQQKTIQDAYDQANAELETDRRRARVIQEWDDKLANGSVEEMLETLGKIRGKSGREVWDQMARAAIAMGKVAPVAAPKEIARLEAQVEKLTAMLEGREQRETEAAATQETEQLTSALKQKEAEVLAAAGDATKFPELARYTKLGLGENIVTEVAKMKIAARRAGRQLDNAGALAQIEAELKKLPAGAQPASPTGAKPGKPAAEIADDIPITGIAPSQTRSAGSVREKTEAELAEDFARDHDALRGLGLLI